MKRYLKIKNSIFAVSEVHECPEKAASVVFFDGAVIRDTFEIKNLGNYYAVEVSYTDLFKIPVSDGEIKRLAKQEIVEWRKLLKNNKDYAAYLVPDRQFHSRKFIMNEFKIDNEIFSLMVFDE